MHRVGKRLRDKRVLKLIGCYLRAGMLLDGEVHRRDKGTPQGGPLSPLLANIYLDALDKELERRGLSFVRYADDLNIHVSSERSARRVYESIRQWIEKHLKLQLNDEKSGTGRPWQRQFLGLRLDDDGEIRVARGSQEKYKAKVRELWSARQSRTSKELVENWSRYVRGWWNYFGLAIDKWCSLSKWTRRHIRKCFWLRWHSKRGRLANLKRLGISAKQLKRTNFYASAWPAATQPSMHMALNNACLKRYGLVTPHDLAAA